MTEPHSGNAVISVGYLDFESRASLPEVIDKVRSTVNIDPGKLCPFVRCRRNEDLCTPPLSSLTDVSIRINDALRLVSDKARIEPIGKVQCPEGFLREWYEQ